MDTLKKMQVISPINSSIWSYLIHVRVCVFFSFFFFLINRFGNLLRLFIRQWQVKFSRYEFNNFSNIPQACLRQTKWKKEEEFVNYFMIIVTLLPLHYSSREGRNHFLFHGSGIRKVSLSWDWNFFHFAFGFDISPKHLRSDCVVQKSFSLFQKIVRCISRFHFFSWFICWKCGLHWRSRNAIFLRLWRQNATKGWRRR